MTDWTQVSAKLPAPYDDVFVWPRPKPWILTAELTDGGLWVFYDGNTRQIMRSPIYWRAMFLPPE